MRARLLVIVLFIVGLLAVGLGLPLGLAAAERAAGDVPRPAHRHDPVRLARRAAAHRGGHAGAADEIERHDQVHGIGVMVVGRDGSVLATSRPNPPPLDTDGQERVRIAVGERVAGGARCSCRGATADGARRAGTRRRRGTRRRCDLVADRRPARRGAAALAVGRAAVLLALGLAWWSRCRSCGGCCGRCSGSTTGPGGSRAPWSPAAKPPRSTPTTGRRSCASYPRRSTRWP